MPDITIKLKPYLQDYLRCTIEEPLMASSKTLLGPMIRPFLEYRPKDLPWIPQNGPEYITFELPSYDDFEIRRGNVYMSEKNQANFQRILEAHFQALFMMYYDHTTRSHGRKNIKNIILQFCADYNLSFNNDFYEMMKKRLQRRAKDERENPTKFAKKLSFSCPLLFL